MEIEHVDSAFEWLQSASCMSNKDSDLFG